MTDVVDVLLFGFVFAVGFTFGEEAANNVIRRYEEARYS